MPNQIFPNTIHSVIYKSMDYIEFDTSPTDEDCVQVSRTVDYYDNMKAEAIRFRNMLTDIFPDAPGFFKIKTNEHDYGPYLEVRYVFDDNEDDGWKWANFIESNLPQTWNDTEVKKPKWL